MTPPLYPLKFAGSKAQKKDFRVTSGQNSSHEGEAPSAVKRQRRTKFVALVKRFIQPDRVRQINARQRRKISRIPYLGFSPAKNRRGGTC